MKLRTQIIALVTIPLIGMSAIGWNGTTRSLEQLQMSTAAEASLSSTVPVSDLIHEMQVERGMSAGFVGSGGANFQAELPAQRRNVDAALSALIAVKPDFLGRAGESFREFERLVSDLADMRSRVSLLDTTVPELAAYYTGTISAALAMNNTALSNFQTREMSRGGAGLISLSAAKEAAGLERAMGATGFGQGAFSPRVFARFLHFSEVQRIKLQQAELFADVLDGEIDFSANAEHDAVMDLREVVLSSDGQEVQGITGPQWFTTSTAWVERLRAFEKEFKRSLDAKAAEVSASARAELTVYASLLAISLVTTMIGGFLVFRSFTSSVTGLQHAMSEIAKKRYSVEIPDAEKNSEMGQLGSALMRMREDLQAADAASVDAAFKGAAFDMSGAAMILADSSFNITQLNKAAERLMRNRSDDFKTIVHNFDPDTLVGQNMDFFHVDPDRARTRLSGTSGLPVKMKIPIGEAFLGLYVDAVTDTAGNHIGYVLEWKDQTHQMANETLVKAIDSQQVRLTAHLDGRIRAANAKAAELSGQGQSDLSSSDISELVHPLENSVDVWAEAKEGRSVFGKFQFGTGTNTRILDGSVSTIPDHKDQPNGFLVLGVDVTKAHNDMQKAEADRHRIEQDQAFVVSNLSNSLNRMASGDLSCAIECEFAPDYEELRQDFNSAVASLLDAMQNVVGHANDIELEASSISATVGDLSKRTEGQAATLEETAAAVEQLTVSVASAASGAKSAAEIAGNARENAQNSREVVCRAVEAMSTIENSSKEISKIIGVMDEIAFQTNLLALNAGVEAARAGAAGRGFAVVASEVRALAQRSIEAAGDINALINTSGANVNQGVELVGQAGEALEGIVGSVAEISGLVENIARSATEQAVGIGEINSAMAELDNTTQQNAAMAEETSAAALMLDGEAKSLVKITSSFKIGDTGQRARASHDTSDRKVPERVETMQTDFSFDGNAVIAPQPDDVGWEEF